MTHLEKWGASAWVVIALGAALPLVPAARSTGIRLSGTSGRTAGTKLNEKGLELSSWMKGL